ncbi:MAG: transposase [Pseudomonadota bacterium]
MPKPDTSGKTVFYTVALKDRSSDLLTREIATLRHAVVETRRLRPFQIDAWVVLPNHMHCVWTLPDGDGEPLHRWRMIKGRFGRTVALTPENGFDRLRKHGIFSRQLREYRIRTQADWEMCVEYCWNDPVKHGLAATPQAWPFSSWHRDHAAPVGVKTASQPFGAIAV